MKTQPTKNRWDAGAGRALLPNEEALHTQPQTACSEAQHPIRAIISMLQETTYGRHLIERVRPSTHMGR